MRSCPTSIRMGNPLVKPSLVFDVPCDDFIRRFPFLLHNRTLFVEMERSRPAVRIEPNVSRGRVREQFLRVDEG